MPNDTEYPCAWKRWVIKILTGYEFKKDDLKKPQKNDFDSIDYEFGADEVYTKKDEWP